MSDRWALIETADDSWDGVTMSDAEPTAPEDGSQYAVRVPPSYPNDTAWSPALKGFADRASAVVDTLLTVGRFKLLLTKAERVAIRTAAASSTDVEDFLDLLAGFTDGVSLSDPLLIGALSELQTAGLLTADRVAAILAGQTP